MPSLTSDASITPKTLTVTELNRQARRLLESHFDYAWVTGEVSNFAAPSSGHWYFSLKDGAAQVRCAMFRNRNQRVRFTPKNGDAIRLRCRVSLYEGRGEFQLIVEHLEHAGAGALQEAFEKLKAKLQLAGLFDQANKKPLPVNAQNIGIITSPTGAVVHDIITVLGRRCPGITAYVLPVAVQGEGAAAQIQQAIETANRWRREGKIPLDALIVGRGGGSLEDLWAFNTEQVALAIAASDLPIVSAVGHEVDFSIADLVADQRAATPSAAAELLSSDQRVWLAQLRGAEHSLGRQMQRTLTATFSELGHLRKRLKHPGHLLREQAQRLDDLELRLRQARLSTHRFHQTRLALLQNKLQAHSPLRVWLPLQDQHHRLQSQLTATMQSRLQNANTTLAHLGQLLDTLSPLKTLDRGYSIIRTDAGKVVMNAAQVSKGERLHARLAQGELVLKVDTVTNEAGAAK